jgi:protoheme IX farnesyltransferase
MRDRVTDLVAASTAATYLVILAGATVAVTGIGGACPGWPACGDAGLLPLGDAAALLAVGYRVLVAATFLLVLGTVAYAQRNAAPRRVRGALGATALLYPAEIGLGALVATGATPGLQYLHLGGALAIFAALTLALTWALDDEDAPDDGFDDLARGQDEAVGDDVPAPADEPVAESAPTPTGLRSTLAAYLELTKPRLMWLLCLVALAAMGMAAGPALDATTAVATLAGGVLAVGASGTFNNVIEREEDRRMERTADRPVVQERVPVRRALAFGVALAVASVAVFLAWTNALAALLGFVAILFYSVGYTVVLKPNTSQNIVIGGAVGAFPALIGWAAVTGTVGLPAVVLGAVVFAWTPAHFYNLALAYEDDYERAGFPMLPVVRGETVTRKHILWYLGATLSAAATLAVLDRLGWLYVATAVTVGAVFLWAVVRLHYEQTESAAFRAFHASNAYLGMLLLAVLVDAIAV